MWAWAGFAFYLLLMLFLGVVYSWNWAGVVLVMGLIPAFMIWLFAGRIGNASEYYDWDGVDGRKK